MANSNEYDVEFGEKEVLGPDVYDMIDAEFQEAITMDLYCPRCKTALRYSAKAFAEGKVKVCLDCTRSEEEVSDANKEIQHAE